MKKSMFQRVISTGDSVAFLPLRLVAGLTIAAHGAQKMFGWFGGGGLEGTAKFFEGSLDLAPGVFWAGGAGAAELIGGLLIAVGFLTRFGAALTGITMAGAIYLVHSEAFFASEGGMEYALVLLAVSLTLLIAGGGGISIDRALSAKKTERSSTSGDK